MRFAVTAALVALFAAPAWAEVKVGDPAPDFTLKDQEGKEVKLSSFAGKKNVLLAFYPKDHSAGCKTEMKTLVREWRKIQGLDFVTLGISVDTVESHKDFAASLGIAFPLLSDPDLAAAKLYDVAAPGADGGYAMRSAFVVDKDGKVRWLERSLKAPRDTLEGTELWTAMKSVGGAVDPVAELAELPALERDGKTVFVRWVQALLAEDMNALDALLDPEACGKPGETAPMQRERRKTLLERWRALTEKHDLRSLKFADVADVRGSRVFAKADATPAALTSYSSEAREMAARLADGEALLVGRTSAPKLADATVLPRDVVMRLRQKDGVWRIMETN